MTISFLFSEKIWTIEKTQQRHGDGK